MIWSAWSRAPGSFVVVCLREQDCRTCLHSDTGAQFNTRVAACDRRSAQHLLVTLLEGCCTSFNSSLWVCGMGQRRGSSGCRDLHKHESLPLKSCAAQGEAVRPHLRRSVHFADRRVQLAQVEPSLSVPWWACSQNYTER